MKQSQVVVLSALGLVALYMILMAGLARVALSQASPEDRGAVRRIERGPQTTTPVELQGFRSIDVRNTWRVTITRSDSWSVELTYPENLRDDLRVRVAGDSLVLSYESNGWSFRDEDRDLFRARISLPALGELQGSGVSQLEFSGFSGDRLAIALSGAAQMRGSDGWYGDLEVDISGAGNADLSGIAVRDANVDLSGAAQVTLTMDGGVLAGDLSGASVVRYAGSVSELRVDSSGAARVVPVN